MSYLNSHSLAVILAAGVAASALFQVAFLIRLMRDMAREKRQAA